MDAPGEEGGPDGMTVDAEGCVWSARWGGSCLVRYRPDGTEERSIEFPAKKVSSVIFGGPDYADIYVTTAGGDNKAEDGQVRAHSIGCNSASRCRVSVACAENG